ncbi:hypothetical protein ABG067_003424 [Albugo candida]
MQHGQTLIVIRVPGTNTTRATETRRASPVITRGNDSVRRMGAAVNVAPTMTRASVIRPEPTMVTQQLLDENARLKDDTAQLKEDNARLKEDNAQLKEDNARLKEDNAQLKEDNARLKEDNAQLKEDNARLKDDNAESNEDKAQLSRTLLDKTTQLQDATEQVCKLKADVEELEKRLDACRQRNIMCQSKLDAAMKVHEEHESQLNQLTDRHNELKLDLRKSKTTIQDLKVFMEAQQTKLDSMQKTRDTKTFVLTGAQTTATGNQSNSRERLYRLQHEEDESKVKDMMKEELELKTEAIKSRSILKDFRHCMETQLAYLDAVKAGKELHSTGTVTTEAAGTASSYQRAAACEHQAHPTIDLITSLRMQVNMLELKLKDCYTWLVAFIPIVQGRQLFFQEVQLDTDKYNRNINRRLYDIVSWMSG